MLLGTKDARAGWKENINGGKTNTQKKEKKMIKKKKNIFIT